jgi:arylsulfatase A-like enzyme
MWNFVGGFRETPGADKWNTWPEYFKKKGYYTKGCGKIFHPGDPKDFDPQSWTGNAYSGYYSQGSCPKGTPIPTLPSGAKSHGCPVPDSMNYTGYPDYKTMATAKELLQNATKESQLRMETEGVPRPFWIGVGFVKPHMPHVFPKRFLDVVPALEETTLATNMYPVKGASFIEWGSGAEVPAKGPALPATNESAADWRRNYHAAAAFSDHLLGELLTELDNLGHANNTIIVLTGDHGWGTGEHNHWVKYTNWETDARVPLMIHDPFAPQTHGKVTLSLVEHVDLYPSLVEMAMPGQTVDKKTESIEGDSYAVLFDASRTPPTSGRYLDNEETLWTNKWNASFTQYPRCNNKEMPTDDPGFITDERCASVKKQDFRYMGYSMRTTEWRYTEWAVWDGTTLKPIWTADPTATGALVELYDHKEDIGAGPDMWNQFENANLAAAYPGVVKDLSARLRAFYADMAQAPARRGL